MFPHQSLILAILRLPFSALRWQRELSEEQYAYCFEHNSLWHLSAEKGNQKLPDLMTGGGFHFPFFIYMACIATLFLLKASRFMPFLKFVLVQYEFQKKQFQSEKGQMNLKKGQTNLIFSVCICIRFCKLIL